ncbi:MAG: L,D-transpeptidase family protein [Nocardioidaceae bacterium]
MVHAGRWVGVAGVLAGMVTGVAGAGPAAADPGPDPVAGSHPQVSTATSAASRAQFRPRARFAREFVRRGDADTSTSNIEHVRELQYRLRWAGVYRGPVTGTFGDLTKAAVRRFQKGHHLDVNGNANFATWARLIPATVRAKRAIPDRCKLPNGWHVCYDRAHHQVTLWKSGRLWNSWLVRGGDYGYQTRTGSFEVYYRDKDHVSGLYGSAMPYSQFFSGGQAFHGSPYMIDPFDEHSHGCVNMYIEDAHQLWQLTSRSRLKVAVYGAWD